MPAPTIRLIAEATEHFDDESVYSLGLAEDPDGDESKFAVIFSTAEPDHQNAGYCVVAEPGQRTAYGAIASCELDERLLRIQLTDAAAVDLELPIEFSLDLAVDSRQLAILARGLARVGVPVVRRF